MYKRARDPLALRVSGADFYFQQRTKIFCISSPGCYRGLVLYLCVLNLLEVLELYLGVLGLYRVGQ